MHLFSRIHFCSLSRIFRCSELNFYPFVSYCTVSEYSNTYFSDSTPNKSLSKGVKYFYHFRREFLPPYGIAHNEQSFSDEKMKARIIGAINCEFITQPWIGVSEFADTMLSNAKFLEESKHLLDSEILAKFLKKVDWYKDSFETINSESETAGNYYIFMF